MAGINVGMQKKCYIVKKYVNILFVQWHMIKKGIAPIHAQAISNYIDPLFRFGITLDFRHFFKQEINCSPIAPA